MGLAGHEYISVSVSLKKVKKDSFSSISEFTLYLKMILPFATISFE